MLRPTPARSLILFGAMSNTRAIHWYQFIAGSPVSSRIMQRRLRRRLRLQLNSRRWTDVSKVSAQRGLVDGSLNQADVIVWPNETEKFAAQTIEALEFTMRVRQCARVTLPWSRLGIYNDPPFDRKRPEQREQRIDTNASRLARTH
jgi:hypothetical protein